MALPNEDEDNNRPPTPWARSKSKQNIDKLKDNNSDIHLLIGDYDDKTNQIKVVEITSNGNEWQGRNNQPGRRKQGYKTLYHMRRRQRMTNDNGTINYEEGELRREGRAVSGQWQICQGHCISSDTTSHPLQWYMIWLTFEKYVGSVVLATMKRLGAYVHMIHNQQRKICLRHSM